MREQQAPFCIQVELTEGCNLMCAFCGLNGIRQKPGDNLKFMTVKVAEQLASDIAAAGWNSRIEFAMHGEPTMNPNAADIVESFRVHLPKSYMMMTSNGGGLLANPKERIANLFAAGLDTLAIDEYEAVKIGAKLREKLGLPKKRSIKTKDVLGALFHNYPEDPHGNPHRRFRSWKRLVFIRDISVATDGVHATLNNHAGAAAPPNDKAAGKRCAKPFREMSVRWDGNIAVCCNDWRGEYKCGNMMRTPLTAIWQGKEFDAARRKLYLGQRDFGPCAGCDALSYRPALLPDHMGKEKMPKPDRTTKVVIEAALSGKPYTKAVKRPWEKKR